MLMSEIAKLSKVYEVLVFTSKIVIKYNSGFNNRVIRTMDYCGQISEL